MLNAILSDLDLMQREIVRYQRTLGGFWMVITKARKQRINKNGKYTWYVHIYTPQGINIMSPIASGHSALTIKGETLEEALNKKGLVWIHHHHDDSTEESNNEGYMLRRQLLIEFGISYGYIGIRSSRGYATGRKKEDVVSKWPGLKN